MLIFSWIRTFCPKSFRVSKDGTRITYLSPSSTNMHNLVKEIEMMAVTLQQQSATMVLILSKLFWRGV